MRPVRLWGSVLLCAGAVALSGCVTDEEWEAAKYGDAGLAAVGTPEGGASDTSGTTGNTGTAAAGECYDAGFLDCSEGFYPSADYWGCAQGQALTDYMDGYCDCEAAYYGNTYSC